jgi:hypothetical protein
MYPAPTGSAAQPSLNLSVEQGKSEAEEGDRRYEDEAVNRNSGSVDNHDGRVLGSSGGECACAL